MTLSIFHFNRSDAEDAIQRLTGAVIGKQKVRLSWGRNLGNKQVTFLISTYFQVGVARFL